MRRIIFSIAAMLCAMNTAAQEETHMMGLLPDDGTYETLPRKAELLTRDYTMLPSSYSLRQYCPEVRSQGYYGTCTSWAVSYAARTIAEAVKYGWTDKQRITQEAFSPIFVYTLVKAEGDDECQKGTYIHKSLQMMKEVGVPKLYSFNVMCANYISDDLKRRAAPYKIDDYFTLFGIQFTDGKEKIRKVKKSLTEDCPVVIAMWLPNSFHQAGDKWSGIDIDPTKHGYHAMCVIGYDDEINGGSFQIMNSWGRNWGNQGFVWVRYSDFAKYVDQAYEVYVKKDTQPKPEPKPEPEPEPKPEPKVLNLLSGSVELCLSTGEKMVPVYNADKDMYEIQGEYISRTRYRVYISNNEPAYVYMIGSDLRDNTSRLFPPADNISAALTYKSNHVAIPDETYYLEMDDVRGKDYLCVLYSKEAIDINAVIGKMKTAGGGFRDKVMSVVSDKTANKADVSYASGTMTFKAETEKTLVPVFIEIKHI